jgi:hypothetical protein
VALLPKSPLMITESRDEFDRIRDARLRGIMAQRHHQHRQ